MPKPEPVRTCALNGTELPQSALLRFALSPDGFAVPDLARKLGGKGAWLTFTRDALTEAARKNPFPRAFRKACKVPENLVELVESQLENRFYGSLGFARRAGRLVFGFEKVRKLLQTGDNGVYLSAAKSDSDSHTQLLRLNGSKPALLGLDDEKLGQICGADSIMYAAIESGAEANACRNAYGHWQAIKTGQTHLMDEPLETVERIHD